MSTPRHQIAAGRSDLETAALAEDVLNIIHDILDGKLLGIVNNGRVPSTAIVGQMGPGQGGTGNARGEATPLDGSVTDAKVASDADIQPSKLDQTLLKTLLYTFLKIILLEGTDVEISPDDLLETLTFSILAPDRTLDSLSDVIITAPAAGDMLMAFLEGGDIIWRNVHGVPTSEEGAIYMGGGYITLMGEPITMGG